jgi:peptidoglycan/xylan/chitin deacetylase (PgdA/CDA1 family)
LIGSALTAKLGRLAFPGSVWSLPAAKQEIYLTFDDGPDPSITPKVLDVLKTFNAKATFFCIGRNVEKNPEIFERILLEGHRVGNHTFHHKNGWKTPTDVYLEDVERCKTLVHSNLFRPPYGKMTRFQAKCLHEMGFSSVMWSVLTKDYDSGQSLEQILKKTTAKLKPGAIVVFHDSLKAAPRMLPALPLVLEAAKNKRLLCASLPETLQS